MGAGGENPTAQSIRYPAAIPEVRQLDDPKELEAFLDGVIAAQLDAHHIAGATVAVVKDGEVLAAKGYGVADYASGNPVDAQTLFRIGSITKLFTWTAVMQLVEQGVLDLDADINDYLDFEIPATFSQPITLKHLMTHTAGFEEMGFGLFAARPEEMISNAQWLKTHIPARIWAPGLVSAYSNYGAALAGYIVERQSGLSYEEYVSTHVLLPLGMNMTSLDQPLPEVLENEASKGYRFEGGGYTAGGFEIVNAAPAGSISSGAQDMSAFMIAHLNLGEYKGQRILDETTALTMHSRLWGADSRLNGWAYGFFEMNQNGIRVIGHGGDTRLFHSLLALLPDEQVGLFVSYNTETDSMAPQELLELFMDRYFAEPQAAISAPPAGTLERASQVAGSYRMNRIVLTGSGKIDSLLQPLIVQAGKDGSITIPTPVGMLQFREVAPYYYEQIGGDDKAVFWLNEAGQVTYSFLNSFPMLAAERVPWYEAAILHLALVAACLFLSLTTLLAALFGIFNARHQVERLSHPRIAVISRWVLGISAFLILSFVSVYAVSLGNPMLRLTGQHGLLDLMGWIALGIAAFTAAALVLSAIAWKRKCWRLSGRIHYSLVALSMVVFTILLVYYNQIGWQY